MYLIDQNPRRVSLIDRCLWFINLIDWILCPINWIDWSFWSIYLISGSFSLQKNTLGFNSLSILIPILTFILAYKTPIFMNRRPLNIWTNRLDISLRWVNEFRTRLNFRYCWLVRLFYWDLVGFWGDEGIVGDWGCCGDWCYLLALFCISYWLMCFMILLLDVCFFIVDCLDLLL